MHTVDYFAVGAAILCTARVMAHGCVILTNATRIYAALIMGIGLGMFSRDDFDCKVYLSIGATMIVVEVTLFACHNLCPSCAFALMRAGEAVRAFFGPRPVPSKVERLDTFYGREPIDPAAMQPLRVPPPPKKSNFS
jgi:hypothetical protein